MLDQCSAFTIIDAEVSQQLGLKGKKENFSFRGFGAGTTTAPSISVSLEIVNPKSYASYRIDDVKTFNNLQLNGGTVTKSDIQKFKHLQSLDLPLYTDVRPKILIGLPHAHLIAPLRIIKSPKYAPVVTETRLGWGIFGKIAKTEETEVCQSILHLEPKQDIHDIKEMFHQVKMKPEDQHSQRILWRNNDKTRDPEEYAMQVMTFGATCSPFCAQLAKNTNAREFESKYPRAAEAIIHRHYVDDYLDSCDSSEEALQLHQDVVKVHSLGGFHICNWITNDPDLRKKIPVDLRADSQKSIDVEKNSLWTERVLGLHWDPNRDVLVFTTNFNGIKSEIAAGDKIPTKREALSLVMSVFDPMGFVGILTVKAKILLQLTWRSGITWDEQLPRSQHEKWREWISDLQQVVKYEIPRCYSHQFSSASDRQLHVFVDASEQAFAAVCYFRVKSAEGTEVTFVSSKTRVTPLKSISIPRAELQAAVLGTRMAIMVKESHDISPHRTFFWSDSVTVLRWLRMDGGRLKQFVSHRIGEIQESTNVEDWHWIPTDLNVADDATRDDKPCDWSNSSRWRNGPSFLKLEMDQWPKPHMKLDDIDINPEILEVKKDFIGTISERREIPVKIEKSSHWFHLQLKQWKRLADHFWSRWIREYLPTLTRRTKWFQKKEPLKIGDVVIVIDNALPRNSWPKGIIEEVNTSKDGQTRSATIRTNMGTYRRPTSKICVLDVK